MTDVGALGLNGLNGLNGLSRIVEIVGVDGIDFATAGAAALIAYNDRFRRDDVEDGPASGLVSVDEWARSDRFGMYVPTLATVAPRGWSSAERLNQAEYSAKFGAKFPEVMSIVRSTENVCVAGGAAAWPFCRGDSEVGDVDFFVYDMGPDWGKAHEVAEKIRAAYADARRITETLSEGLLTFDIVRDGDSPESGVTTLKLQLVLRAFKSKASMLHGFDVCSSCVCFDGERTQMTALGAFAMLYRANIVYPPYQSTSYAHRLAKYFRRGFALVFAHMRSDALQCDVPIRLGQFGMCVTPRTVHGRFAVGDVETARGVGSESDYDPLGDGRGHATGALRRLRLGGSRPGRSYMMASSNTRQLASGSNRFVLVGVSEHTDRSRGSRHGRVLLPLASYAATEPTFEDVLPRAAFEGLIDAAVRGAVRNGVVNVRSLQRVLGLEESDLATFVVAVGGALATGARRVGTQRALAPFRAALVAKYDAVPAAMKWWIVDDPSRQFNAPSAAAFTVSRNPRPETPMEWYGEVYDEAPEPPTRDETIDALLSRLNESRGRGAPGALGAGVFYGDGTCALCLSEVERGGANTVTLECRHTFHCALTTDGCRGIRAWWSSSSRSACPVCRHDPNPPPTSSPSSPGSHGSHGSHGGSRMRVDVELEVPW